jgi:ribosomal protein S18 acetylase RimI-like enzyme
MNKNALLHPPLLPSEWKTTRLVVQDSQPADVPHLHAVFSACAYVEPWDPTFHPVPETDIAQLVENSVSMGAEQYRFKLQCLRLHQNGQICGYFHLYHGVPQPHLAWISMFVLHPDFHGQRIGQEAVAGLADELRRCGYPAIWLRVYLKNWPALRFWIEAGFTTVVKYEGKGSISAGAHSSLILAK